MMNVEARNNAGKPYGKHQSHQLISVVSCSERESSISPVIVAGGRTVEPVACSSFDEKTMRDP